jgi:hypothetical protein
LRYRCRHAAEHWLVPYVGGRGYQHAISLKRETLHMQRLAKDDPGRLAQIAYGLLPRDVFISVQQTTPGNLEPEAWATLRRVLDLIEACRESGCARGEMLSCPRRSAERLRAEVRGGRA